MTSAGIMRQKRFAARIILLTALILLAGCAPGAGVPADSTGDVTLPVISEAAPAVLEIVKDGKSEFEMVRLDESHPMTVDCTALIKLVRRVTGADIEMTSDIRGYDSPEASRPEIIVGACKRREAESFIASLPENGYGIRAEGNKLIIAGKTDSLTAAACRVFENQIAYNREFTSNGNMTVPAGFEAVYTMSAVLEGNRILSSDFAAVAVFDRVATVKARNGFQGTQGSATDGRYFYVSLYRKANGVETDIIVKKDVSTSEEVAVSEELPLDHCNDICYDSLRKRLVVANMKDGKLTFVDPGTLAVTGTAVFGSGNPYAIAYNEKRDRYAVAAGGRICITDGDFNILSTIEMAPNSNYVGQGMDADDDYIYMPMSPSQGITRDNIIIVYSWDTGYKKTAHMRTESESETLMNFGGRKFVTFNGTVVNISEYRFVAVYG